MKYLFWLVVVLVAVWAFKRSRPGSAPNKDTPAAPKSMVACAHCGIHLPAEEAVAGQKGLYCSTGHRSAAQDRNPG